jgi:hypothetical protein
MPFQITALDPDLYAPLFAMSADELAMRGGRRVVADKSPSFPCRVSLVDAKPGETLILVNHEHLGGETPYRQRHAIYVREGAERAYPAPGEVPSALLGRPISLRAHDAENMMVAAGLCHGKPLAAEIDALLEQPEVAFVHLHNAMHGCFVASAARA